MAPPSAPAVVVALPVTMLDSSSTPSPPAPIAAKLTGNEALTVRWRAGLALDTALRTALLATRTGDARPDPIGLFGPPASGVADTGSTERIRALLLAEAAVLHTLRQRNDSLLRTLEEAPAYWPIAGDSGKSQPVATALPAPRAWALTIGSELTGGWGTLPGLDPAATEKLRNSHGISLNVARQLTDRWRLRAGAGQAVVRTQLTYQRDTTAQLVHFDTTYANSLQVHESVDTTYLILIRQVMHIEPIPNNMGQIIDYDTSYIPTPDTIYQVVISHDTLRTQQTVVTRRVDTWRDRREQLLRPEYRFWTIPVSAQYALLTRGRLRLGVSAGAQALIFRGGARPVRRGDTYALARVGPRDGPFRPVSVAWQGSADVEWRFGPCLSASVAPGLRGWVVRPERGLRTVSKPVPSLQVGLTWGF
ncbi:MAG: hypothetical protein H7330_03035 [Hymenobacteraceae bacterium]|nr:hypothetical protein [Hymenobacteraceae bacterium]